MAHSKVLQKIAYLNPEVIDQYFWDDDGHWIWLKSGFVFLMTECGTLREDTVAGAIENIKMGIEVGIYKDGYSQPVDGVTPPKMAEIVFNKGSK